MAHPCPRGCISRRSSAILAYRATALRHLSVAIHELWMPRPHRISTGCLVSQSVGMAPDHAATGRLLHGRYDSASTKAAPEQSSYHPCRCCAPGRFSAPSLPNPRTRRHAAEGAFGRFRPPAGSDGALRLGPRPNEHRHGAHHRVVGAGPLHVGPAGVRRPRDAPAALDGHRPHQRRAAGTVHPHRHMRPWVAGSARSTYTKPTAAGTTPSPPAPGPPRCDAWPRCRRTSSAPPSHQ